MKTNFSDQLNQYYEIIEDLTPSRVSGQKTYLAFFSSQTECTRVILKELDQKRTALYHALFYMWNPYIANILLIHEFPDDSDSSSPASVAAIEYVDGLPLSDYISKFGVLSPEEALSVCIQLCKALNSFHLAGIIHRDIKPDNIMIINQVPLSVKLIDFGGGTVITNSSAADAPDKTGKYMDTTVIGTPGYQAPESLIGRTGAFTDIFSIGCVLNFMLTGEDPGFKSYQGRSSIQYIIRKSTNEDPSMRFKSLIELERLCRHELRYGLSDRIPIIRSVPGYRSHTKWKSVVASMYYLLMLYELVVLFRHYPVLSFTLTTVFWVVIPSIIIGNIGYVQEYFPEKLKQNNRLFILLKTAIFLVCLFVPLILY